MDENIDVEDEESEDEDEDIDEEEEYEQDDLETVKWICQIDVVEILKKQYVLERCNRIKKGNFPLS